MRSPRLYDDLTHFMGFLYALRRIEAYVAQHHAFHLRDVQRSASHCRNTLRLEAVLRHHGDSSVLPRAAATELETVLERIEWVGASCGSNACEIASSVEGFSRKLNEVREIAGTTAIQPNWVADG